ncbi:MAG: DUF1553 domain-containing protein [Candidatus Hydrogenedentes bacterium]|nr:DUF1553 domain-containing protein [Candidatus Hydrogenedentota bacterium]
MRHILCPCLSYSKVHIFAFLARSAIVALILFVAGFSTYVFAEEGATPPPVSFGKDIVPIFQARCVNCHGPEKQKAKLRLDTPEFVQKGNEDGPVIVAGKPAESKLCKLISLPADDADRMPGDGDPLTPEQIALIARWISEGASFATAPEDAAPTTEPAPAPTPEAATPAATPAPVSAPEGTLASEAAPTTPLATPTVLDELAKDVPTLPAEAVEKLRGLGVLVMPVAAGSPLLNVDLQFLGEKANDDVLKELAPLAEHITWLNLARTAVTDDGLAAVSPLKKLTRIHLERTGIGDAALGHLTGLTHLEYLNLYGTKVSDAGLEQLRSLPALHRLYVWQTQVTTTGAENLKAALPEVEVNLGTEIAAAPPSEAPKPAETADATPAEAPKPAENAATPAAETPKKTVLALLFDADSCCDKAHHENQECEHPCCKEAAAKGEVCVKCNPNAAKKSELAARFDQDGCCAKAAQEGKQCDHPCCKEAWGKGDLCTKCNPNGAQKVAKSAPGLDKISFNKHVRPILAENCFQCHGPDSAARKADLRLDVRDVALAERDGKRAIVPGDSAHSQVIARVTHADPAERMPPAKTEKCLTPEQIALLTRWIGEGAEYEPHWSYINPVRPENPTAKNAAWTRNPIDAFVLAKLDEKGLEPSAEADPVALIRRLSFDLIGLPPTPEDVDAFAADSTPDAYERLVDRLLASPQYGERMAVHWLDLVRYADTNGFHGDEFRSIYPYRDYVIKAFNENMRYDQSTLEQLAGDLIPNPTTEQLIASGYNRLNQITAEGGAQAKEYVAKYAADRVRTTAAVWLGSTMGCAECHDHKFDPFTMKDFYSFGAFFADVEEKGVYKAGDTWDPFMQLPNEEQTAHKKEIESIVAKLQAILDTPTEALAVGQRRWEAKARDEIAAAQNNWTVLVPARQVSSGGAKLKLQEDFSVLASGENPAQDVYTLTFRTDQQHITGLRLEAIVHPSLKGGLARGNGNFVLTGIEVEVIRPGETQPQSVKITSAQADLEQKDFPITAALDGDPKSGWAVSGHEIRNVSRQAVFTFAEAVAGGTGTTLTVRLRHESDFAQHAIGCFRIALTTAEKPALGRPRDLDGAALAALWLDEEKRSQGDKDALAKYYRSIAPELAAVRDEMAETQLRLTQLNKEIPTTLITRAVEPRVVRILPRGNWLDESGEIVTPSVPHFLPQLAVSGRRTTRKDLAEWLVSAENPLAACVFVNHLWKLYFGTGLSKVLDDLGTRGEWPTHPELLDWLAVEFRESGWDIKHMVKLVVMSSTYRQTSAPHQELEQVDPYNRLLARQSRVRLSAEFVRDNALLISGLLSKKIGGRSVFPYQPDGYWDDCNTFTGPLIYTTDLGDDQYRRGLYTVWKRSFLHPSLLAFDAPCREECTAERVVSNTPLQALALLNDPTYVETARVFAEHIIGEGGASTEERLNWAYRRALSRKPSADEIALLTELCNKHRTEFTNDKESAQKLIAVGQCPPPQDIDPIELAGWTSVARAILNMHETITKL